jgi:hypothetical protein
MEVIERSMDEAGVVHVMLEWLKVCNAKAMEVIERIIILLLLTTGTLIMP